MWDVGGLFGVSSSSPSFFSYSSLFRRLIPSSVPNMCNVSLRLHITSSVHCNVDCFFCVLLHFFRMIAPHVCVQVVNTHKIIDTSDSVERKHTDRDECTSKQFVK